MLQDMKKSSQEQAAAAPGYPEAPKERYPYGLKINLGKDELEKLGLKTLPKVGQKFQIEALATVESVHETAGAKDAGADNGYKSCELQLTHLSLDEDDGEEGQSDEEALYGGDSSKSKE